MDLNVIFWIEIIWGFLVKFKASINLKEQAKIAKLGLEMKLIQNEIEAEADKWNEPQNEIVKVNAHSLYPF